MTDRILLRGGSVVTPTGVTTADVLIDQGRIAAIGTISESEHDRVIDVTNRLVMPGFIDAHSHADGLFTDAETQTALLRQGVTTVIAGQDGVSYAPGDGAFGSEYFAAINGPHPRYRGGGVAAYLEAADGTSPLNVGYLIPAGTVRYEVCGRGNEPATNAQRQDMAALVEQGMRDGALGLSTGLDYVPGIFQDANEIASLCVPVAGQGGVYVTHMRGGYEANSAAGIAEIAAIAEQARVDSGAALPVHVSHFHADAEIVLTQLDTMRHRGLDASFDAYPYIRGCTLLAMPLLPPNISMLPVAEAVAVLTDPDQRREVRATCIERATTSASLGPDWPEMITIGHIAAAEFDWAHGLTIHEAANRAGVAPIDIALDMLVASKLECNAVMAVRNPRPDTELAKIFAAPNHMGGSDGIFVGKHPHPRACGTFARYLRVFVRELATWTWPEASRHLSAAPAERFALGDRGVITTGAIADLIIVDPDTVADANTYDAPRELAVGIEDVFVAGVQVLAHGARTGATPGRGIRRERSATT